MIRKNKRKSSRPRKLEIKSYIPDLKTNISYDYNSVKQETILDLTTNNKSYNSVLDYTTTTFKPNYLHKNSHDNSEDVTECYKETESLSLNNATRKTGHNLNENNRVIPNYTQSIIPIPSPNLLLIKTGSCDKKSSSIDPLVSNCSPDDLEDSSASGEQQPWNLVTRPGIYLYYKNIVYQ